MFLGLYRGIDVSSTSISRPYAAALELSTWGRSFFLLGTPSAGIGFARLGPKTGVRVHNEDALPRDAESMRAVATPSRSGINVTRGSELRNRLASRRAAGTIFSGLLLGIVHEGLLSCPSCTDAVCAQHHRLRGITGSRHKRELANKCRDMAIKSHPPPFPLGNKAYAQAERDFFRTCVAKKGQMPDGDAPNPKQGGICLLGL